MCVFMYSDVRRLTSMVVIVHHTFSDVQNSPSLLFEVRWFENDPDVFVRADLGGIRDGGSGINQGDTGGAARTAAVAAAASPV